jgi:hypothetical protein
LPAAHVAGVQVGEEAVRPTRPVGALLGDDPDATAGGDNGLGRDRLRHRLGGGTLLVVGLEVGDASLERGLRLVDGGDLRAELGELGGLGLVQIVGATGLDVGEDRVATGFVGRALSERILELLTQFCEQVHVSSWGRKGRVLGCRFRGRGGAPGRARDIASGVVSEVGVVSVWCAGQRWEARAFA